MTGPGRRVVIAPDSFGGTLDPREAAEAIAAGWRRARPDDVLDLVPLSDGGEGLLEVLARPGDERRDLEVVGPLGTPVVAAYLRGPDGRAVVESARAAGLALVPRDRRDPLLTTSWGVGQLIDAALSDGATQLVVGLGGSATVDGGAGALSALGLRLTVADGSGLKVGGGELARIAAVDGGRARDAGGVRIELLADVTTGLTDAAARFGPQKGADEAAVARLVDGLARWAEVAERDLPGAPGPTEPGTGAAGGLGFGLAAALGATIVPGAARVAELVGLDQRLVAADLVVTGEGRLDATTREGKVVDHVLGLAAARGVPVVAVVGMLGTAEPRLTDVEASAPDGPGPDPASEVAEAAARLAARTEVRSAT